MKNLLLKGGGGSSFDYLVGKNDTLKNQISLAKAAIAYPSHGLNTLLVGSTGCGKSTFAETMYKFGVSQGFLPDDVKFIMFNCADYAENPQLLTSYIFGSVKGAFTGAEKDRPGLIDSANGGVLFLDEVHRLPPEGQELLFTLIDRGIYRRLGETESLRKANVLIIAATTEKQSSNLLLTFKRRIPITIEMPDLNSYNIHERMEFIYNFFYEESLKIKKAIKVSKNVLKACINYDCVANIGGLKGDIQLICARAYFSSLSSGNHCIEIKWDDLTESMRMGLLKLKKESDDYLDTAIDEDVVFYYKDIDNKKLQLTPLDKIEYENQYYDNIVKNWKNESSLGVSDELIGKHIEDYLEKYFTSFNEKVRLKKLPGYSEFLSKIVDDKIVSAVIEGLQSVGQIYGEEISSKIVCALALHVNNLMVRIRNGEPYIETGSLESIKNSYPIDYYAANQVVEILQEQLNINIHSSEVAFLTILLHTMKEMDVENRIAVLIICHGKGVASGIAEVVNKLLETNYLHAIDMPLEESVENILQKAIKKAKEIDMGKGILLMTDMGSLCRFDTLITEETGIQVEVIDNVTTLMALEATRKSYTCNDDLKTFKRELIECSNEFMFTEGSNKNIKESNDENFIVSLKEMLTFIDAEKVYDILNKIIDKLFLEFELKADKFFAYRFIMHCAFMLERQISKNPFPDDRLEEFLKNRKVTIERLVPYFKTVEEKFATTIALSEYVAIIQLFDVNYNKEI